jgi:spermidine synthase
VPSARGAPEERAALAPLGVLVCVLFFASGSAGLVYEVAWKHLFSVVFGNTTYAVSVVISVFMGGLALGSFVFGGLADRARRHLLVFALLQLGIGLSALAVPVALDRAEGLYGAVFRATESGAFLTAVQVVVSGAILLPATFLMGGTLPVLSRYMASRRGQVGPAVGLLYGLNTLGAAAGAFVTGFFLIKAFGTQATIELAVGTNAALAAAFFAMHFLAGPAAARAPEPAAEPEGDALSRAHLRLLLAAVAVSGFVAFSYEVLWTRLLSIRFNSTIYGFSIMLTTFLLGLGLGGAAVGAARRRRPRWGYWRLFAYLEAGIGVCGLVTMLAFLARRGGHPSFLQRTLSEFGTAALVMLVPTTLMGAAFPIACHLFASGVQRTGRSVGEIYVFNTVGAVAGALLTAFLLVGSLGTQRTLTGVSVLMVASGTVLFLFAPARGWPLRRPALAAAPLLALWCTAIAVWTFTPPDLLQQYFLRNQYMALANPGRKISLVGYAEGVEAVVVVTERADGVRTLSTGQTEVAGTGFTVRNTQKLQAHVPMLIHPDPAEVCQVGFGSGETAHLFAGYDVERFDCVEISRAVMGVAAEHFADINGGIVEDPDFNAIIMDASTYLRHAGRRYDVIANDASWPHLSGPAMLYTREYFEHGRRHLKEGGIMTSWLPLQMPSQDFRSVLRSFRAVFPHVYVWCALSHFNKHALIIGSGRPLRVDAERFMERFERFARRDLALVGLDEPAALLACHLAEIEGDDPALPGVPVNTEDHPVLRFLGSRLEYHRRDADRAQTLRSLAFLAERRDSILKRLDNLSALQDGGRLAEAVGRMERANDHVLRALTADEGEAGLRTRELGKAVRIAPSHPAFAHVKEEMERARRASEEDPGGTALPRIEELARRLAAMGLHDRALPFLQEWAAREPRSPVPQAKMAALYEAMDEPQRAETHARRAREMSADEATAHYVLGGAFVEVGLPGRAAAHLEQALALRPDSARVLALLGMAHRQRGETESAETLLRRALALEPDLVNARYSLASLLYDEKRFPEAIEELATLLRMRPRAGRAHRLLGEAYRDVGDEASARRHLRIADELGAPQLLTR